MSAAFFLFELADGTKVTGAVQGAGGKIGGAWSHLPTGRAAVLARERMEAIFADAARGDPVDAHEPRPGCLAVFPEHGPRGDGPATIVVLAEVLRWTVVVPAVRRRP